METSYLDRQRHRIALTRLRWHGPLIVLGISGLAYLPAGLQVALVLMLLLPCWSCSLALWSLNMPKRVRARQKFEQSIEDELRSPNSRRFGHVVLTENWILVEQRFTFNLAPLSHARSLRWRMIGQASTLEVKDTPDVKLRHLNGKQREAFLRGLSQRAPWISVSI